MPKSLRPILASACRRISSSFLISGIGVFGLGITDPAEIGGQELDRIGVGGSPRLGWPLESLLRKRLVGALRRPGAGPGFPARGDRNSRWSWELTASGLARSPAPVPKSM